ncbi:ABC transporter permease [Puia dinghuensis]|uniref:ABC transporter permease n=1 Tax=Puia dinghuensis TaxID=1792502 RepID=A0A8J2UIZ8_9BACT|nr:ABC transporter permease [Puia dinghuensis]GGB24473.1 ABC transporter permease [Puia dinghuensis]
MLKHHLRIAWRNIRHHKLYTTIHVLGLSLGICACMVIYLIARFDLSFDRFHPGADRIYRIVGDFRGMRGGTKFLNSPIPEVAGIEHDIPGFEAQVGFHTFAFSITVPARGGKAEEQFSGNQDGSYALSTILTGPAFFDLFPHKWLIGNPAVLNDPDKVVLAESAARRYFGPGPLDAMLGRTLIYEDSLPVTVAGIVKDWGKQSDLNYTSFISIRTAPSTWVRAQFPTDDWRSMSPHQSQAFVRLAKGVDPAIVNARLAGYARKTKIVSFPGATNLRLYLQPLLQMHYTADFHPGDTGDDFRRAYLPLLYALMGVAVFILVLAIINFINLSTAQSLQRVKEVGIRKVMGSSRKGLIGQFLVETLLVTLFAIVLSVALVRPALALFSHYIPYGVKFDFLDTGNLLFLLATTLVVTLAAGFYPARLLSSYLPVLSLKGALDRLGTGGAGLRKALIIFQFMMSLLFIIASLAIGRQVRYMQEADKGFTSDAILTLGHRRTKAWQMQLFAQRLRATPGVQEAILQGGPPMPGHGNGSFVYKGSMPIEMDVAIQLGDAAFIPFYKMRLLAGRNLLPGDSSREVVINATYAHALELTPADAVGKLVYTNDIAYTVVGVVADFHQESFRETIKPMIIRNDPQNEKSIGVRLATLNKSGEDAKSFIAGIEPEWKKLFPKMPFYYSFLNESIARLYNEENRTAWLMQAATVITILISCMGLFGLALFSVGRRAKEIGIRKVMGATVGGVALLLSRDFLLLVVAAIVIASPIAWYFTDGWLRDFAYRKPMDAWILAEAGFGAIGLALLTVGFQALRAARANPVKVLRSE